MRAGCAVRCRSRAGLHSVQEFSAPGDRAFLVGQSWPSSIPGFLDPQNTRHSILGVSRTEKKVEEKGGYIVPHRLLRQSRIRSPRSEPRPCVLPMVWSINDRDRVNFDQVAGGQRRYAEHHVRWLVISEQRYPRLFNNRQAFVAFVMDDVDCDPGDLRRPRTGSSKCSAEIAKHLARLNSKITRANKLAMYVFGLLARDEYHLASRRNDDLAVRLWSRQILGIDAFERH